MNQKNLVIMLIIMVVLLGTGLGYVLVTKKAEMPVQINPIPGGNNPGRACTEEAKVCPDGSAVGRTGPNCEFAPCPEKEANNVSDLYAEWNTYLNDVYSYEFRYPKEAAVSEARQQDFSLPAGSKMTFEEAYKKYTGKICISVSYKSGGVNISAPVNKGNQYVICGRTGIGNDTKIVSSKEKIKIDGTEYDLNFQTLKSKSEDSIYGYLSLKDETQINFYGDPEMKSDLIKIVESYKKALVN